MSRRTRIPGSIGTIDSKAVQGKVSTLSLDFDGVNEYVSIGDVSPLQFERTNAFSLSCWVKTTNTTSASVIPIGKRKASGTTREGYSLAYNPSLGLWIIVFANDDTGGNKIDKRFSLTTTIGDDVWHHVCLTYSGSSTAAGLTLYVDTTSQAVSSTPADNLTASMLTTAVFNIGSRDGTANYWTGKIDEVSVWDKQLSAAEVAEVYHGGYPSGLHSASMAGNLVGWWRNGERDTSPTITDSSSSGNNGTMTNMEAGDIVSDAP